MANDALVRVGFATGGVPILQIVDTFIDSSRLCGRCRHRGLWRASSDIWFVVDQAPGQGMSST